jgi:hypothetical protein
MPIAPDSMVSRTEGAMTAALDAEIAILNPETENYVGLNEIGRRVWNLLENPRSVADLCQAVAEYQGNPQVIGADLMALLNELDGEQLLVVSNRAVTGGADVAQA